MIKEMRKVIILILIVTIGFNCKNVNAASAYGRYIPGAAIPVDIKYSNGKSYQDNKFQIRFDYNAGGTNKSLELDAYCIDVGYTMMSAYTPLQCTHVKDNAALQYAITHLTTNHTVNQLVLRLVAIATGEAKSLTEKGGYLKAYIDSGGGLVGDQTILAQVKQKYEEAMRATNASVSTGNKLQFTQTGGSSTANSYTATYNVSTIDGSRINSVSFACENCNMISQSWNGTNGSVTIQVTNQECNYNINAYYNSGDNSNNGNSNGNGELYLCTASGLQQLVVNVSSADAAQIGDSIGGGSNTPTQSYTGTVPASTGGEYYAKYCQNKCNTPTEINMPAYCDDSGEENISIKGPSNIKACVLKGKDEAGNSYQDSTSVPASNPYCAVYCKEDYDMSLPGAQYTTSGKYFQLKNTTVTGKRSCYVTSEVGGNTDGIDLSKYKKEMVAAQQQLINAYNEYSKAKALYDNKGNAATTITRDCEGKEAVEYNLTVNYTYYRANCSESTGQCTISSGTASASAKWGAVALCGVSTDTINSSTGNVGNGYNCHKNGSKSYVCTKEVRTSATIPVDGANEPMAPSFDSVSAAMNTIKSKISSLQQCYNWTNNFCFNPDVDFDYNEEYNSDINYEKVSEDGGTTETSIGTSIDNAYNPNGVGSINETINYIGCTENSCTNNGNIGTNISSNVTYVRKSVTKSASFNNRQQFQTNYPHGTINTVTDQSAVRQNYSYLGAVFPVALKTDTGVYNWTLNFKNIGQYNTESCKLGRLNQVATATGKVLEDNIGYVCVYVVDCDDCDYGCNCPTNLPDGYTCVKRSQFVCEIIETDEKCDNCDVYCVNCIFDGDDTYSYRTISLSDINPNNRTLGANWSSAKGQATESEIEKNNESIYIEPDYSYTITATQMKNIRDYNKQKGTYIADDLTYHKLNNFNNIYGTSSFLDEGQSKGFFTENKRNTSWTLWTGEVNTNGIGPSWK